MNTIELLDKLQRQAMSDEKLRKELLETRKAENPLGAFCRKCRELGYEIYEMELVTAGEEFYAEMKRSTNGGGENSPKLDGEDDFYEMFLASMEEEEEYEQSKKKWKTELSVFGGLSGDRFSSLPCGRTWQQYF